MTINGFINYIIDNKDWLFSGLGIAIFSVIIALLFRIGQWILQSHKSNLNNSTVSEEDLREMDKLVAPLHSNIGNEDFFIKKKFDNGDRNRERVNENIEFWENIEQNKHLGSSELRFAIDNFDKSKSDEISIESYEIAKTKLYEVIEKRYKELQKQYSKSRHLDT